MRNRVQALGLLLCLGAAAPTLAGTVLTLTEHHHIEVARDLPANAKANWKPPPADEDVSVTLTLVPGYVIEEQKGERKIFDYKSRRFLSIKLDARTYEDRSLFSLLGFSAMEFQNRLMVGRALAAGKFKGFGQPALIEQLFSMTSPDALTDIKTINEGGKTVYFWNDTEFVSADNTLVAIPEPDRALFWRWFRAMRGGHPLIDSQLARRDGLPKNLRILRPSVYWETIDMSIESATAIADTPYSLEGITAAEPMEPPYPTIRVLGDKAPELLAARSSQALRDREAYTASGAPLDAALSYFSYTLSTGDQNPEWLTNHKEMLSASKETLALFAAIGAEGKEQNAAAAKTLQELKAKATPEYAYVLDVFRGNAMAASGQIREAEKSELAALNANPTITGMWFDLGRLYFDNYQADMAWACWDTARRLRPEHPFRANVDQLEARLLKEHPEFY